jgi:nitrile hydratase subunit beta
VNGIHDLGGMHGFGPIVAEPQDTEPVFHAEWEKTVLALFNAVLPLRRFSLDRFRRMIEMQSPIDYLRHSYYENWYASIRLLATDSGLVGAGRAASPVPQRAVKAVDWRGSWAPVFASDAPLRYAPGDRVRALNRNPAAHTRQPRYVRGRAGVVVGYAGAEPLPERAADNVCTPEHVYRVRFEAAELWGAETTTRDALYIELWESYLEPAP